MFDLVHVIIATLGHSFLYLQYSPPDMDIGHRLLFTDLKIYKAMNIIFYCDCVQFKYIVKLAYNETCSFISKLSLG